MTDFESRLREVSNLLLNEQRTAHENVETARSMEAFCAEAIRDFSNSLKSIDNVRYFCAEKAMMVSVGTLRVALTVDWNFGGQVRIQSDFRTVYEGPADITQVRTALQDALLEALHG